MNRAWLDLCDESTYVETIGDALQEKINSEYGLDLQEGFESDVKYEYSKSYEQITDYFHTRKFLEKFADSKKSTKADFVEYYNSIVSQIKKLAIQSIKNKLESKVNTKYFTLDEDKLTEEAIKEDYPEMYDVYKEILKDKFNDVQSSITLVAFGDTEENEDNEDFDGKEWMIGFSMKINFYKKEFTFNGEEYNSVCEHSSVEQLVSRYMSNFEL